ncbi:MAG: uracil-xanthine permease family protein, partial [Marinobacter sp.]
GGLMAAGILYIILSGAVRLRGTGFITRLLPPVVIGPVIMVIGLGLAPVAVHMASGRTGDGAQQLVPYDTAIWIAMISLAVTVIMAVWSSGIFRLIPIMFGIIVGYILSAFAGIVDLSPITNAPWFAIPNFVAPEFSWAAILFMIPVAIAPAIEHIGDILAIGTVTRKNYLEKPGLHRTLLGDGLATSAASALGGPPNTTYSEVTGAVVLTKNFNPKVMIWAACIAIVLAFIGKFGAALQTIPAPVMGGILCLLFGSIAVVGLNTLIRHQVDLSQARNLVIVAVTLVFGIGGMAIGNLEGIALCAVVAIALNLILPGKGEAWGARIHEQDTH